jgi:hypothetical protein
MPMLAAGVRQMERLPAEDLLMLWPDKIWPQDIGALGVLDGNGLFEPGGRVRIDAVREAIAPRLHLVPRFRQLLCPPARGLGRPLWVDPPAFDLSDHVREARPPAPAEKGRCSRTAVLTWRFLAEPPVGLERTTSHYEEEGHRHIRRRQA